MGAGTAPKATPGPRTRSEALALWARKHLPRCDFTSQLCAADVTTLCFGMTKRGTRRSLPEPLCRHAFGQRTVVRER